MPEVTAIPPGFPAWTDLGTPDLEASRRFYCGLFGWYVYELAIPGRNDYLMFTLADVGGPEVAGMQELADDTQPPSWTCFFRSDDIDASLAVVEAEGGRVLVEPSDVAHLGRFAVCMDSQGAEFALWLPFDRSVGAGVADEPSARCWVELACEDIEEARHFYGKVFGWDAVERQYLAGGAPYTNWRVGDWSLGGMVKLDDRFPPDFTAHWIPYFWVTDPVAATEKAVDLGARVLLPPTEVGPGRFSVLIDPTGARLGLFTPAPGRRPSIPPDDPGRGGGRGA
ncbi:VOC family protein [Actinomadura madurae]|uniref:VOC family protein n=1 Tax=Actinomadura madurae TaxID=1993 RepID=UPI00399A7DCF